MSLTLTFTAYLKDIVEGVFKGRHAGSWLVFLVVRLILVTLYIFIYNTLYIEIVQYEDLSLLFI